MECFEVKTREDVNELNTFLKNNKYPIKKHQEIGYLYLYTKNLEIKVANEVVDYIQEEAGEYESDLIFGKDKTEGVVSIEIEDDNVVLFFNDGSSEVRPLVYWMLAPRKIDSKFTRLKGNLHYKYIRTFPTKEEFRKHTKKYFKKDTYQVYNPKEAAMIYYGITLFKGLKFEDVSILSFDIEAEGLTHHSNSQVFLITNTFRSTKGKITKKHFRVDEYQDDVEMIKAWCDWVVEMDPTILNGHNCNSYDIPYLVHCYGEDLPIGKEGKPINIAQKDSNFRVDGNQVWTYKKIDVFGRHLVDGTHLAVKYDIGRNYPSWGLKQIAEYEGIVKEDRQFYDASKIGQNWSDPEEREKIVAYGVDDSDDSLALYDIHAPSLFYMTQSIPKPYQLISQSASGSQLNAIMVRSYLQGGYSIPKANEGEYVAGGMSYGIPGIYENVVKWDAKSYYPSTVLAFDIYDPVKDPQGNYLEMVRYFTYKRFEQKDMYKKTKDKYYDDLQASSKTFINSAYGLLGTKGLNFNSYENAQLITKCCRAGLQKAIIWATGKDVDYWWSEYKEKETHTQDMNGYKFIDEKTEVSFDDMPRHDWKLVNLDTDSLSFCKNDGSKYTEQEKQMIFEGLNKIMYSEWEDDGEFDKLIVIKAKNYVMKTSDGKIKIKGSSIMDAKKEPALREMLEKLLMDLMDTNGDNYVNIYEDYIQEAVDIQDINRWAVKKSITDKVLNPGRKNEQVVLDAIVHLNPREGDKYFLYNSVDGERQKMVKGEPQYYKDGRPKMEPNRILRVVDEWNKDEDKAHYIKRVYKTMKIIDTVIDMDQVERYDLKSNMSKLLGD
jgi:DNA polymerase elongation subunit (family B)